MLPFRVPDTPPRDFELRILRWAGLPLLALVAAGFVSWACEVRAGRQACEQRCSAIGSGGFVYIPADEMRGRAVAECHCDGAEETR